MILIKIKLINVIFRYAPPPIHELALDQQRIPQIRDGCSRILVARGCWRMTPTPAAQTPFASAPPATDPPPASSMVLYGIAQSAQCLYFYSLLRKWYVRTVHVFSYRYAIDVLPRVAYYGRITATTATCAVVGNTAIPTIAIHVRTYVNVCHTNWYMCTYSRVCTYVRT
jgi:hypothetical protein